MIPIIIVAASLVSALICCVRTVSDARAHITRMPSVTLAYALTRVLVLLVTAACAAILAMEVPAWAVFGQVVTVASLTGAVVTLVCLGVDLIRHASAKLATPDAQARRALASGLRQAEHDAALEQVIRVMQTRESDPAAVALSALADQLRAGAELTPEDAPERVLVASSARTMALACEIVRRVKRVNPTVTHDPARLADLVSTTVADSSLWR